MALVDDTSFAEAYMRRTSVPSISTAWKRAEKHKREVEQRKQEAERQEAEAEQRKQEALKKQRQRDAEASRRRYERAVQKQDEFQQNVEKLGKDEAYRIKDEQQHEELQQRLASSRSNDMDALLATAFAKTGKKGRKGKTSSSK